MILLIASVTVRQLLRQRRMLLLVFLALIPVAVSTLFRIVADDTSDPQRFTAGGGLNHFVVNLTLPLTALLVGTSALGQDLEEGTVVYLIGKPLARWKIILAKVGAAWVVTAALVGLCAAATGLIPLLGHEGDGIVPGFTVAVIAGSLAYVSIFVTLSIRFSRALVIGLAYVFVWEAIVSQFISGVRFLSVRSYTLGIADGITSVSSDIFRASLGVTPAVLLLAILVVATTLYSVRGLVRYQISERV